MKEGLPAKEMPLRMINYLRSAIKSILSFHHYRRTKLSIRVKLTRIASSRSRTFGAFTKGSQPLCVVLEPPWKNNQENISCIPVGVYKVKRHISPSKNKQTGGEVFWLQNVKDRTYIYIHIGNRVHETLGCMLVGSGFLDDGSGVNDSTKAMEKLLRELPDEFELEVAWADCF